MKNADATTTTTDQAATAETGANTASPKPASKKAATKKKAAPKAKKAAKAIAKRAKEPKAKTTPKAAAKDPGTFRPGSKGAKVLELISRSKGGSLAEIMKATGWQAHSVRGFISGTLGTKHGLNVASAKREDGERVYSLAK